MSWKSYLHVTGGEMLLNPRPSQEGGFTYTADGRVECLERERLWAGHDRLVLTAEYEVRFKTSKYRCPSLGVTQPLRFSVLGGFVHLRARQPKNISPRRPQPSTFIDLCQALLLLPDLPRRQHWGYVFSAYLRLPRWDLPVIEVDDTCCTESCFVRFALFAPPIYRYVAPNEHWQLRDEEQPDAGKTLSASERFDSILRERCGWAL